MEMTEDWTLELLIYNPYRITMLDVYYVLGEWSHDVTRRKIRIQLPAIIDEEIKSRTW